MQNFRALGAPPPHPRASGGWGLCPQTPSLQRLGASPPDPHWPSAAGGSAPRPPKQPPPLRISGYAPALYTGRERQLLFFYIKLAMACSEVAAFVQTARAHYISNIF